MNDVYIYNINSKNILLCPLLNIPITFIKLLKRYDYQLFFSEITIHTINNKEEDTFENFSNILQQVNKKFNPYIFNNNFNIIKNEIENLNKVSKYNYNIQHVRNLTFIIYQLSFIDPILNIFSNDTKDICIFVNDNEYANIFHLMFKKDVKYKCIITDYFNIFLENKLKNDNVKSHLIEDIDSILNLKLDVDIKDYHKFNPDLENINSWKKMIKKMFGTHICIYTTNTYDIIFDKTLQTKNLLQNILECTKEFMFCILHIISKEHDVDHMNGIIIDIKNKTLYRYEPSGENIIDITNNEINNSFVKVLDTINYKYITNDNTCNLQLIERISKNSIISYQEFPEQMRGYCVAWSLLILHLQILNPQMSHNDIKQTLLKIDPNKLSILVRKYASYVYNIPNVKTSSKKSSESKKSKKIKST